MMGILAFGATGHANAQLMLCPGVFWEKPVDISLNDTEKRLVCGETTPPGSPPSAQSSTWRSIPAWQAEFSLKGFLQERGYFNPVFRVNRGVLYADPGPLSRVEAVQSDGGPITFHLSHKREVLGQVLTPALLSQLEAWSKERLSHLGYPCPTVRSEAFSSTGEVLLHLQPGPHQDFASMLEGPVPGVRPGALRRYDAFELGKPFDGRLLELTQRRIMADGALQSVHLRSSCGPDGAIIHEHSVPGPPRLLSLGVGANSEGLLLGSVTWKNARLGEGASQLTALAEASAIEQVLDLELTLYADPSAPRLFVQPQAQLTRDQEKYFDEITLHNTVGLGTSWELFDSKIDLSSGPALDWIRALQGPGPSSSEMGYWDTSLNWMTHGFEYYQSAPRTGFQGHADLQINREGWGARLSAQRLSANAVWLANLGHYDPPLWVIGLRGGGTVTLTGENPSSSSLLPVTYRQYLGGSRDLRGFGREELPSPDGALSSAYLSTEARLVSELPWELQPFAFLDMGALGVEPLRLDRPLYWSPGIGIRWQSPVGPFRVTAAHGYLSSGPRAGFSHWQFYLSFGEEF